MPSRSSKSEAAVAKARPTNEQTAARQEIGWSLDWNFAQISIGNIIQIPQRQLLQELAIMADTDETVGSMLWCISSTMAQIRWKHVPQLNGIDNEDDAEAVKMAEFADTLLTDMGVSFPDHVDDAITMVWAGFAPCEIVLKQRTQANSKFTDQYWGIDNLKLRDPISVLWWNYDQDRRNVISMRQMTFQGSATIPLWKMNLYRTTTNADRPTGRSLLSNAHRVWKLKNRIQDAEALGIERELCGLPIFRIAQSDIDTANEKDGAGNPTTEASAARDLITSALQDVENVRLNRTGGVVLPSDTFGSDDADITDRTPKYDFKIVTSAGQRSIDARSAVRDYDMAIARTAMMQFLHLGSKGAGSGSYALSDDQSAMAVNSLMALAIKIAAEWNAKTLGLVWSVNAFDPARRPRLQPSNISKEGIAALGQFFSGLAKADWLLARDAKARIGVLKAANVPYDATAQEEAAGAAAEPPPAPVIMAPPGASPNPQEEPADGSA